MGPSPDDVFFKKEDYQVFQNFLQSVCGIALGDNKQYLVSNRMRTILQDLHISTLTELVRRIESGHNRVLRDQVIDAMTTNETFWFRDGFPFEALHDAILPHLLVEERRETVRIWSSACSSGQEPYSISMVLEEFRARYPGALKREPAILATDISSKALTAARDAAYDNLSINRGLSAQRRAQFFDQLPDGRYRLKRSVASRVEFRTLNLLDSFSSLGRFDIIFCRNVLIYFAADLKCDILRRMRQSLSAGGYLILGASESMPPAVADLFVCERIQSVGMVYRAKV